MIKLGLIEIGLIELGISILVMILSAATFAFLIVKSRKKEIKELFDSKADKDVTEKEFSLIHEKINSKAEKGVVNEMSKKIDVIYDYIINKKLKN